MRKAFCNCWSQAGWNHLQQAMALAAYYDRMTPGRARLRTPRGLLAGLDQLVPWLAMSATNLGLQTCNSAWASFIATSCAMKSRAWDTLWSSSCLAAARYRSRRRR